MATILEKGIFSLCILLIIYLSKDQILALIIKNKKPLSDKERSPSTSSLEKPKIPKSSYASNETIQKPTPLYIKPEDVKNYDDRPWRPFRWPYHQTMSIFKLDINHWLDMDKYYQHYIDEKKRIRLKYGKQNFDMLPEGREACTELMETVVDHMLVRYPLLFTLMNNGSWENEGKIVKNEITNEIIDMTLPLKEQPLVYVSKFAKEDFYVVLQNPKDNLYYLVGGAVPFPGGSFSVSEKMGKNLDAIHVGVPYYKQSLKRSMERWFSKLRPQDPVERASWYITWDTKLKFNNIYHTPETFPELFKNLDETSPKQFNVRVERQTLRKLPKSQAVIFTNHPVFYSIEEMKDEPMIPSLLKKILYEGPEDILKYKNFELIRDKLSPYLDSLIKRQIEKGIITEETPLKTQPNYPFACWVKDNKTSNDQQGWNNPSPFYNKNHMKTEGFDPSKLNAYE
ncbi:uncharacterized protein KGF55_002647 [Candida pseudojiufengensis]|uniref:uncharacterized protein n=1 Tax=Candida pseudojiufengensis TaxID=497109 RepID=UPI002224C296|nr:uncharacterized protein KGF55_002647 [Candida pseudojiufengensis]KAI5963767.1 hypothetical protein KGF55_002647 [Candida pseudojiufengensis]